MKKAMEIFSSILLVDVSGGYTEGADTGRIAEFGSLGFMEDRIKQLFYSVETRRRSISFFQKLTRKTNISKS
jgi:hypothetical protein